MDDATLDDDVRARQADALPLEDELREDEVRRRRPDVDADRAQTETLGGDVAVATVVVMRVVVRVRVRQRAQVTRGP
ncbi:MAG TPA: hypothetical protein VI814_12215 [Candidatus Limnocylindria bacterium]